MCAVDLLEITCVSSKLSNSAIAKCIHLGASGSDEIIFYQKFADWI